MHLSKTLLASLLIAVSTNIYAASKQEKTTSLQEHSKEYSLQKEGSAERLSSAEIVEQADALNEKASQHRLKNIEVTSQKDADKSQLDALKVADELEQQAFLIKNVPVAVRTAGEKAIKAHVQQHFIEEKVQDRPVERKTTETIWQSSQSTLSALPPIKPQSSVHVGLPTTSQMDPAATEQINKPALDALGITQRELNELAGDEKKPKIKKTPNPERKKTHSIGDIKWERVVVMGNVRRADLSVKVKLGDEEVTHSVTGLEPGGVFNIGESEYTVESITDSVVVFTDNKSKKSYRVSVK